MELDYSQLDTYQACPQKYYLQYKKGLQKKEVDEREIDIKFGELAHRGLESLYRGVTPEAIPFIFDDFENLPPEAEKHKTRENGKQLLRDYIVHYKEIDKKLDILEVEVNDTIEIIPNITWRVKIDTIVKMMDNIYVLEHKTTKKIGYRSFLYYNPNTQISGYTLYVKKKYGQCSGVIVNILQSGYRKKKYKGEPAGFHSSFQREIINRSKEQLEDFKENVALWAYRMENDKMVGKNEGSCHQYRGCPYKELCLTSQGIKLDEEILEALYEEHDPFEYLKEGVN